MASTCGSTLALMDAGVPIKAPVAGIAMGLITEGDKFAVLTDIQGMEDFSGDMDFKVAGTAEGITALQLDTKIQGIPRPVFVEAFEQARQARLFILDRIKEAIGAPRENLSIYAPRIITIQIDPEQIGTIIGPGGKTIKKITADTGAKIDIEQDGSVHIASVDGEKGEMARRIIESMTKNPQPGEIFEGKITRFLQFGAFVEIVPGKDALVHVSQISDPPPSRPDQNLKLGDTLRVRITEIDGQGRINATARGLDEPFDPENPEPGRPPRGAGRPGGGDRGGFGGGRDRDRDGGRDRDRGRGPRGGGRDRDPERAPAGTAAVAAVPEGDEDELPKARFRPRR
jgi:polyribonucleotide nucleotidyltransferase